MLKFIVAFFVAASVQHGCHDPLKGSLAVDETLAVRTSKGFTTLQPGNYQLTMTLHGDRIVLNLKGDGQHGQKVRLMLERPPKTPDQHGDVELLAAESGQPFDLVGHVTSVNAGFSSPGVYINGSPMSPSIAPNAPGPAYRPCAPARSYPLVDDASQQIEVRQSPIVSSIYGMEQSTLTASIRDPLTGRTLGRLSATLSKTAASTFNSGC